MKISITALDKRFSKFIRTRAKWTCQRCLKKYRPPTNALHCAHMFSRRHYGTRFHPDNCVALCYGCHSYIDSHPIEKIEFFKKRIGKTKFDYLNLKSKQYCKKSDETFRTKIWLDQMEKKNCCQHPLTERIIN